MSEKVWLPRLIAHDGHVCYVHRKNGATTEIDYVFAINGANIERTIVVEEEKAKIKADANFHYVLPRFYELMQPICKSQRKRFLDGDVVLSSDCFKARGNVNLVVTGNMSIRICCHAFDPCAKVKLVLPKEMGLFQVRNALSGCVFCDASYLLIAPKELFSGRNKNSHVTEISQSKMADVYDFEVTHDRQHFFDRKSRTIEDVNSIVSQVETRKQCKERIDV